MHRWSQLVRSSVGEQVRFQVSSEQMALSERRLSVSWQNYWGNHEFSVLALLVIQCIVVAHPTKFLWGCGLPASSAIGYTALHTWFRTLAHNPHISQVGDWNE